jgi:phenylacetate-CoA ligase
MKIINFLNKKIIIPTTDRLRGTEIEQYWSRINTMSSWTPGEIRDWQTLRLKELINHAYHQTVYYKEIFDKLGLHPSDIKDLSDLQKIPTLTKTEIINNFEKLIPKNLNMFRYKNVATGGSTGVPLKYRLDMRSHSIAIALRYYFWHKAGYNFGDRLAVLGGSSILPDVKFTLIHKTYHSMIRKTLLNAVNMSDEVITRYLNIIANKKITVIYGYPSAIFLMAIYAAKRNLKFPNLKICITTGEILPNEYREKIISGLKCKVMDSYGAMDGGISAYKSKPGIYHAGYNSIVEVENRSKEVNCGNILATDLLNYALPFIRYKIGDEISLLNDDQAEKYYNGQIITNILGRNLDIIRLENGHVLMGIGFTGFFRSLNVRAFRIVKICRMHIECTIQKNENYTQDEENLIISTFKKQAGQECKITFKYLEYFDYLHSGKRNYLFQIINVEMLYATSLHYKNFNACINII